MEPPGTRVIVHKKPDNRTSWVYHSTPGWYIGLSLDHYICIQCHTPATGIVRITDTLQYTLKAFSSPKTTTEDYLQQEIGDIIAVMKDPLKIIPFSLNGDATKIQSTRLHTFCKEAQLSPASKFYCYPQCYHRARMKVFNHQKSPAYQHQLRGWNRFCNLRRCKHKSQHPHRLQESSLPNHLAWIISH